VRRYVRAAGLERHHHFDFVMELRGERAGVGNHAPSVDYGIGWLHEEEGWLTIGILAHLAGVGRVVASDAERDGIGKRWAPVLTGSEAGGRRGIT
jgi:hypothetical protein